MAHCHKCNKQGNQTHEWWTRTTNVPKFKGHYYKCQKYGHREFECRSKPTWPSNKVRSYENSYIWDYNTRYSCHYYQQYGHIVENYIRTHFSGNYNRWLSQTTCFSCHKTGHVRKDCLTRSKAPKSEFDKGKTEVDNVKNEMNETWKKKEIESTSNGEGITSLNESSDHTSSN